MNITRTGKIGQDWYIHDISFASTVTYFSNLNIFRIFRKIYMYCTN